MVYDTNVKWEIGQEAQVSDMEENQITVKVLLLFMSTRQHAGN